MTKENAELKHLKIKFIQQNDEVLNFTKGWSGDATYLIKRGDQKFFLKIISRHTCDFDNFKYYQQCNILTPKILDYGTVDKCKYYITEHVDGSDFGDVLENYSNEFIFKNAKILGKQQRMFSEKFGIRKATKEDVNTLFDFYDTKTKEFFKNLEQNKDKVAEKFKNVEFYKKLLVDIEQNKQSFLKENVFYCHDDFMPNNFMIDKQNKLWTIDIESTKYGFYARKLRGYIQHMFHKREKEKIITFFRGFSQGFFNEKIPKILSSQMAYIYIVDMIDICNNPLKKKDCVVFEKRINRLFEAYQKGNIEKQCAELLPQ